MNHPFPQRFTLLLCGLVLLSGCWNHTPGGNGSAGNVEHLSVRLPVPEVRAPFGPWYAAEEEGYFARENLKVDLNYGGKGTNPVAMVMSGSDDIGILGGPDTALVAISKGAPLKIIAVIHRNSNFPCLITKKESGITNISQLDGKKVGMFSGHISTDVLRNLFRKAGIHVTEVDVGYDYSQFIAGNIDAQWAFTPGAAAELPEKGIEVNVISPEELGIVTHGYALFTTDKVIQEKPDAIRRFLKATFDGVVYMTEHPAETAEYVVQRDKTGNLDQAQVLRRIHQYNEPTSAYNPYPPGYFDREMLQSTYDRLKEEQVLEKAFPIESAYTMKFLDEIHGDKMLVDETAIHKSQEPVLENADGN